MPFLRPAYRIDSGRQEEFFLDFLPVSARNDVFSVEKWVESYRESPNTFIYFSAIITNVYRKSYKFALTNRLCDELAIMTKNEESNIVVMSIRVHG